MKLGSTELNAAFLGRRDAFHVAAVLVFCTEELNGGDSVRFDDNTYKTVVKSDLATRHAVADPFVGKIELGQMFWAVLIPDRTKNLTHQFDLNFDDIPAPAAVVAPAPVVPHHIHTNKELGEVIVALTKEKATTTKAATPKKISLADRLKSKVKANAATPVAQPEPIPQSAVDAIAPEVIANALEAFHKENLEKEQAKLDAIAAEVEKQKKKLAELKEEEAEYDDYDDGCRGCN
jgi:hypothetical protein